MSEYLQCDVCKASNARFVLASPALDGPLVKCVNCGMLYVGRRKSQLAFGAASSEKTAEAIRQANLNFRDLALDEERRLGALNARWRLDRIRELEPSGSLLEIGCARGDFLEAAKKHYDVKGVEPNPELARCAATVAPVHQDVVENLPWNGFDVVASFHVIEHVDSPSRFVAAAAERLKPGGVLVLETPNIDSLPFRILRGKWRQFIPEHYFFFAPATIERLLNSHGLKVESVRSVGKYASLALILNRASRYLPWSKTASSTPLTVPSISPISRLTFRVNPLDIMLVAARRVKS